jgi:hypothetical protein
VTPRYIITFTQYRPLEYIVAQYRPLEYIVIDRREGLVIAYFHNEAGAQRLVADLNGDES